MDERRTQLFAASFGKLGVNVARRTSRYVERLYDAASRK